MATETKMFRYPCSSAGHPCPSVFQGAACPHCGRPSPAGFAPPAAPAGAPLAEETLWRGTPSGRVLIGKIAAIVLIAIIVPLASRFAASYSSDLESHDLIIKIGWWLAVIAIAWQAIGLVVALMRLRSTLRFAAITSNPALWLRRARQDSCPLPQSPRPLGCNWRSGFSLRRIR